MKKPTRTPIQILACSLEGFALEGRDRAGREGPGDGSRVWRAGGLMQSGRTRSEACHPYPPEKATTRLTTPASSLPCHRAQTRRPGLLLPYEVKRHLGRAIVQHKPCHCGSSFRVYRHTCMVLLMTPSLHRRRFEGARVLQKSDRSPVESRPSVLCQPLNTHALKVTPRSAAVSPCG